MAFRDYDPAVARWVVMDPVVDFDRTSYGAHNGNPVFWADPSGANAEFDRWVSGVESDWAAIDAGANPFEVFFNRSWLNMQEGHAEQSATKRAFNVLKSLFEATGGGGATWVNDGSGNFDNADGSGFVNSHGEYYANDLNYEALSPVILTGNSSGWGAQIQSHVYGNSSFYAQGGGGYNVDNAVNWLNNNAKAASQHACAKYVRLALEAGGINTNPHPVPAKDYAPFLTKWGFSTVNSTNYLPIRGDIRVFQPYQGGSQYGHIDMYNGSLWLSDFRERNEFPGRGYRNSVYQIFRWGTYP